MSNKTKITVRILHVKWHKRKKLLCIVFFCICVWLVFFFAFTVFLYTCIFVFLCFLSILFYYHCVHCLVVLRKGKMSQLWHTAIEQRMESVDRPKILQSSICNESSPEVFPLNLQTCILQTSHQNVNAKLVQIQKNSMVCNSTIPLKWSPFQVDGLGNVFWGHNCQNVGLVSMHHSPIFQNLMIEFETVFFVFIKQFNFIFSMIS